MPDSKPTVAIVVPCYNEEEMLPITSRAMEALLSSLINKNKISQESFIYFIDDGSRDETWALIESLSQEQHHIRGIKLARNFGHQGALLAGLMHVREEITISIDADLQDDINVIEEMIDAYTDEQCEVVYGVRKERTTDTFFKRFTAEGFYKLMKIMGVDIVFNHADYRLLSQKALSFFREFEERNLFIRGIVPLIGLKSKSVYYDRKEREAGESKYPLKKMLAFAFDGITSFSTVPLRLVTWLGFLVFIGSIFLSLWVVVVKFVFGSAIPGWASTVLPIYLISGVQILSIGIIGEYLGKIYKEVKKRPRFLIEKTI